VQKNKSESAVVSLNLNDSLYRIAAENMMLVVLTLSKNRPICNP